MFKRVNWSELSREPIEGTMAVLDTNIVFGIGAHEVNGRQAMRIKGASGKGGRRVSSYAKEIMDTLSSSPVHDTILIPESVVVETVGKASDHYSEFIKRAERNRWLKCYEVQVPFNPRRLDTDKFKQFEEQLDERWRNVTSAIMETPGNSWMNDKILLYMGMKAKKDFPRRSVIIVSDDRGDVNSAHVYTHLNGVSAQYTVYRARIEVLRGSRYAARLKERTI